MSETEIDSVALAAELTAAWLENQNTRASAHDVQAFLTLMHQTVTGFATPDATQTLETTETAHVPAVSVRKSLASREHILSLIDGKPYKTLRRHLSTHGMTPEEYRERYGLKSDYPMVAEAYSEARRAVAKSLGLGRKAGQKMKDKAGETADATVAATRRGGKAAISAAKKALGTEE